MKLVVLVLYSLLMLGCMPSTSPEYQQHYDEKNLSRWFQRDEKLPLTIIATAYIDPKTLKTPEYKKYKKLLKAIQQHPSLLGNKITSKFSSIEFVDFKTTQSAQDKFSVAYRMKHHDKEQLNDIFLDGENKPSAELLIYLNYEELQKGYLTIEGYKTLQETAKQRNSYYYVLRKKNYGALSLKEKNQALLDSVKTILQLSIPTYTSVNRKKFIKKSGVLRFVQPTLKDTFRGEVWVEDLLSQVKKQEIFAHRILSDIVIEMNVFQLDRLVTLTKITTYVVSEDERYLLSASTDGSLELFDLLSGKSIVRFDIGKTITALALKGDEAFVVDKDSFLSRIDLQKKKILSVMDLGKKDIYDLHIAKDTHRLWCRSKREIYSLDFTTKLHQLHTLDSDIVSIDIDEYSGIIAVATKESFYLWDLATSKLLFEKKNLHNIQDIKIMLQQHYIAVLSDNTIRFYHLKEKQLKTLSEKFDEFDSSLLTLKKFQFLQNSERIVTLDDEAHLRLWKSGFSKQILQQLHAIYAYELSILKRRGYISYPYKQLVMNSSFLKEDFLTLYNYKYLKAKKTPLSLTQVEELRTALGYNYLDPVLLQHLKGYRSLNGLKTYYDGDVFVILPKTEYKLDELYFSSELYLQDIGYKRKILQPSVDLKDLTPLRKRFNTVFD